MDEKTAPSKNNDCYFYYYSSCSKGDTCPYRHEPAALRNETVCKFWLQGKCNKSNCIFRHMELSKQRDKIACWFESQPGGCKKPHCPFQHQNILDHPREEDIKKISDLILPVKKDESSNEESVIDGREAIERQIALARSDSGSHTPPRQVHLSAVARNPIIVPLQDGESDSESVCGSPYKRAKDPQLSAQLEWELRRLRQIQAHEADIIGYQFEDDDDDDDDSELEDGQIEDENEVQTPDLEEYVVEEVVEVEEDTDAIHRRLHPQPEQPPLQPQMEYHKIPVITDNRKSVMKPQVLDQKNRRRVQISERLGAVASRALAETLGTNVKLRAPVVQRLINKKEDESHSAVSKRITERLRLPQGKKPGVAARLGVRKDHAIVISSDDESNGVDNISSKIANIRYQHADNKESTTDSKPLQRNVFSKEKGPNLNFTVKSLSDIKAERERKVTVKRLQPGSQAKNGTKHKSVLNRIEPSTRKIGMNARSRLEQQSVRNRIEPSAHSKIEPPKIEDQPLKILSLGEIRAKQQTVTKGGRSNIVLVPQKKRSISPISFLKVEKSFSENTTNPASQEPSTVDGGKLDISNLGLRKICIKRSPAKNNLASEPPKKMQHTEQAVKKTLPVTSVKKDTSESFTKNNNVVDSKSTTSPLSDKQPTHVHRPQSAVQVTEKLSLGISKLSRNDSLIEDEEELLLSGDMLELEDDVDEAALLF